MANMSYCRFQNTRNDFEDCLDSILDELDGAELEARNDLYHMCLEYIEAYEQNGLDEV